jgi:hypothetical protein
VIGTVLANMTLSDFWNDVPYRLDVRKRRVSKGMEYAIRIVEEEQ